MILLTNNTNNNNNVEEHHSDDDVITPVQIQSTSLLLSSSLNELDTSFFEKVAETLQDDDDGKEEEDVLLSLSNPILPMNTTTSSKTRNYHEINKKVNNNYQIMKKDNIGFEKEEKYLKLLQPNEQEEKDDVNITDKRQIDDISSCPRNNINNNGGSECTSLSVEQQNTMQYYTYHQKQKSPSGSRSCYDSCLERTLSSSLSIDHGMTKESINDFFLGDNDEVEALVSSTPGEILPNLLFDDGFLNLVKEEEEEEASSSSTNSSSSTCSSAIPDDDNVKVEVEPSKTMNSTCKVYIKKHDINIYKDVLCARGGEGNNNPGNKLYLMEIRNARPAYKALDERTQKKAKKQMSINLIKKINKNGGRFLRKEKDKDGNDQWYEITGTPVYRKVSQALRDESPDDHKQRLLVENQKKKKNVVEKVPSLSKEIKQDCHVSSSRKKVSGKSHLQTPKKNQVEEDNVKVSTASRKRIRSNNANAARKSVRVRS